MGWETEVVRHRRALHEIPELGFEEHETQAYLETALSKLGIEWKPVAGTGLVAEIAGQGRRAVAVRADMDGLPLDEESGEPFSSRHPGRMHACGHDGHMAILLALAERLCAEPPPGRVRLLFQPAEERPPGGALRLIAEGALEGVDEVLGLHLWATDPLGVVAMRAGPIMANADQFFARIEGQGGHGSAPHETQDAVVIAAETVLHLQTVVSRRVPPLEPAVVSVGTLHAGRVFNAIADHAEISGTVRTLSDAVQALVETEVRRAVEGVAALYGARATFRYERGYPAVVNHQAVVDRWQRALGDRFQVVAAEPKLTGEDFAYYLRVRPGAYCFLGARPEGQAHPHHSARFRLHEAALPMGVEVLYRGVLAALAEGSGAGSGMRQGLA
ncbi:MAG: amidohydrolase [Firmicutes bacterium]|nr:amidohydrolase [Alicyclobacillaceae bacterium]MCL6497846.1 amidohydrolase [Bacillota bacterium]